MPVTAPDLLSFKHEGRKIPMLTAYDCLLAQAFDQAGIPLLLVGDTLGIFALGFKTTIPVTMEAMVHHCRAVSGSVHEALVIGDLPFGSYETSVQVGFDNAVRLVKDGGVGMVKLEGAQLSLVETLTSHGVPVMGHLGLTPQSFHTMGGHRVQARTETAVTRLMAEARALEAAGAASLVLEGVPSEAARRVTEELEIPTIGIGAGPHCDGQVLVGPEMLGLSTGLRPRFAKQFHQLHQLVVDTARRYAAEVTTGEFPDAQYSYDWRIKEGVSTS